MDGVNFYSKDEIWYDLNSAPEVDDHKMQVLIVKALSTLDPNIVDKVCAKVIFVSLNEASWGIYINHNSVRYKNKDFILLSPKIYEFDESEQIRIVLHEVAHFILRHKTLLDYEDNSQYDRNEEEADKLVIQWQGIYHKHNP